MPPEASPADWARARQQFDQGLATLGLDLPTADRERLMELLRLLAQWNRAYNLTALRTPAQMVAGHLLDSLAVLAHIPPGRLLDVGTGAGFPGLPLAVARPDMPHVLLDSVLKKTRFVEHAALTLGLRNVEVVQQRAEHYQPKERFPVLVARAFAPLPRLLRLIGHLCAPGGRVLALKGPTAEVELAELPTQFEHIDTLLLPAAAGGGRHTLVVLERRTVG